MRIQRYEEQYVPTDQGSMSPSLPGEKRSPLTIPDAKERMWANASRMAEEVTDITKRLSEGRRVAAYTEGKLAMREGIASLRDRYQDPEFLQQNDFEALPDLMATDMEKLRDQVTSGITDPRVLEKLSVDFREMEIGERTWIRGVSRGLQIEEGREQTYDELTRLLGTVANGKDPHSVAAAQGDAEQFVSMKVAAGYFSKTEGGRLLREFSANSAGAYWDRRLQTDVVSAFTDLANGKPEYMAEEDYTSIFDKAQRLYNSHVVTQAQLAAQAEAAAEKRLRKRQDLAEMNVLAALDSGQEMTPYQVNQLVESGSLSPGGGKNVLSRLRSGGATADNTAAFADFAERIDALDNDGFPDPAAVDTLRGDLRAAVATGQIKGETYRSFLKDIDGSKNSIWSDPEWKDNADILKATVVTKGEMDPDFDPQQKVNYGVYLQQMRGMVARNVKPRDALMTILPAAQQYRITYEESKWREQFSRAPQSRPLYLESDVYNLETVRTAIRNTLDNQQQYLRDGGPGQEYYRSHLYKLKQMEDFYANQERILEQLRGVKQ